jgi:hypothetical protein
MEARVRFTDGETRSFGQARRMKIRGDSLVISGWLFTVAVVPLDQVRWACLSKKRMVSQRDFKKGSAL